MTCYNNYGQEKQCSSVLHKVTWAISVMLYHWVVIIKGQKICKWNGLGLAILISSNYHYGQSLKYLAGTSWSRELTVKLQQLCIKSSIQFWFGFIPVNRVGLIYPTLVAISLTPTLHITQRYFVMLLWCLLGSWNWNYVVCSS
mgnify:CR=1 FL=1